MDAFSSSYITNTGTPNGILTTRSEIYRVEMISGANLSLVRLRDHERGNE